MEKPEHNLTLPLLVWISRIIVGSTFIISGWAKSIDTWGFIYKIEEYFNVWNLTFPREITLFIAIAVAVVEFIVGILLIFGIMRRVSVWLAAAFMVVLLPLTAYIAVADPVSDCGCFGDFIVISNIATLIKNIVLTGLIIILLMRNDLVKGIYAVSIQWLVFLGALIYIGCVAFIGYRYQPLVDFRPYPVGSVLNYLSDDMSDDVEDEGLFIYEKDGVESAFSVDELPDSTWTFVRAEFSDEPAKLDRITVFDEGEDVTAEVLDGVGEQLILAVIDPGMHYLTRARLTNELYKYAVSKGDKMFAFVATEGDELEEWKQLALPEYPVYSVEDTSLKELVRGDAGLIFVKDGEIVWKRNLASVSHDAIRSAALRDVDLLNIDLNQNLTKVNYVLMLAFVSWLIIIYMLNFPERILGKYLRRHSLKNS